MAGFDDLGTELLVVWDVQFSFVVQESVEFFPLEKVVNQSARAFLAKDFEDLSNFKFAIGAVSNFCLSAGGLAKAVAASVAKGSGFRTS
jgi:hypothetical protein